jgi:long-chain acyl-CoA synthetase
MSIVTAYDTLGESGIQHSLTQTRAKAIFVDTQLLKKVTKPVEAATDVKILIYNDAGTLPIAEAELEAFKKAHPNLKILSFEELRALGEDNPVPPVPPKPDDLFCVMYTSGTTGPPKVRYFKRCFLCISLEDSQRC